MSEELPNEGLAAELEDAGIGMLAGRGRGLRRRATPAPAGAEAGEGQRNLTEWLTVCGCANHPDRDFAAAAIITRLDAENVRMREALRSIACFNDQSANQRLHETGSYSLFDEPGSVEIARAALGEP